VVWEGCPGDRVGGDQILDRARVDRAKRIVSEPKSTVT
jgi:hypothetical protein